MSTPPPDPTNPDLLRGLSNYLVSQGIIRDPRDGTDPALPPLWLESEFGTPFPGQKFEGMQDVEVGQALVVSAQFSTGIPSPPYEGFRRTDGVEFVVRAGVSSGPGTGAQAARHFENQVRSVLNDKRGWTMDTVPVNESLLFRDLQPIDRGPLGYTYTMEYMFELWGPFTPVG